MKRIFFTIFAIIIYNLTASNLLAQNRNQPQPQNNNPQASLSPEEKKKLELAKKYQDETIEFNKAIDKLKPADKTRFNNINIQSGEKNRKAFEDLRKDLEKYGKPEEIMSINWHIFNKKSDERYNKVPIEIKKRNDNSIATYNKFDNEKKKNIKKAIIKFRKELNKIQKNKQQEIKKIFGKDYQLLDGFEKEEDIIKDEKTIQ